MPVQSLTVSRLVKLIENLRQPEVVATAAELGCRMRQVCLRAQTLASSVTEHPLLLAELKAHMVASAMQDLAPSHQVDGWTASEQV